MLLYASFSIVILKPGLFLILNLRFSKAFCITCNDDINVSNFLIASVFFILKFVCNESIIFVPLFCSFNNSIINCS